MRALRNFLKITVWTIIIIYLTIIIIVRLPFIQTMLGSQISNAIGLKLGTNVSIGRVNLGLLNRIIVDDLTIYDQKSEKMITAARLAAKIDYSELIKNGRIYISSAQLFGFKGNFYQENSTSRPNWQFALDSLASKKKKDKSDLELNINSLVIRHGALKYDGFDKPMTSSKFNSNHINVKDISAHLIISYYTNDSLSINVKKFSLKETSGIDLRKVSFQLSANKKHASLKDLYIKFPNTELNLKQLEASYKYINNEIHIPSLKYTGVIEWSHIGLSDIAWLIPSMKDNKQKIYFKSNFNGNSKRIDIKHIAISSCNNKIALNASGNVFKTGNNINWNADINRFNCNIATFNEILKDFNKNILLPDAILRMGDIGFKGSISGGKKLLYTDGHISTSIGNAQIHFNKKENNINASLNTDKFNLNKLLADNRFGEISATAKINGETNTTGLNKLRIDGTIPLFDYNGYRYKSITINGLYDQNIFDGILNIDDTNGQIAIKGNVNTDISSKQMSNITASIRNLDPAALKITDQWKGSKISFNINTQGRITGIKENLFDGNISVNNMSLTSENNIYNLKNLEIKSERNQLSIHSDFGYAKIEGQYKLNKIVNSITNILHSKLPTLYGKYQKTDNNFTLNANITKSDWLNAFFKIPLELTSPLKIHADVNDRKNLFNLLCNADGLVFNGNTYKNTTIKATTPNDILSVEAQTRKVSDNGEIMDMKVTTSASDNRLKTDIGWNNHKQKKFTGSLNAETYFTKNENGNPDVHINVNPTEILINDTVWTVKPSDITYSKGNLIIEHFAIEHNKQHIKIDGMATKNPSDSITVDLQDIDVNYILNLVNFHSVDFKGNATGKGYIKSVFYDPDLYADLKVNKFRFEDGRMGVLTAHVNWNKEEKQIDIDAHADDKDGARTIIKGYVSPVRNSIDLDIKAIDTNIEFVEGFCGSFMGDVNAKANGNVRLHGPLNGINLTGLLVADGNIRIKPLNTTYTLSNDTITFIPDNIIFKADTIHDRNGNIGVINGTLHHKHLTRLTYDLDISTKHLLCYDTKAYGNDTFYGTAYGTGNCTIKGGNGRIDIDINITPEKGSFIEYNAASPEAIADQQFITWNDNTPQVQDTINNDSLTIRANTKTTDKGITDIPSDMRINFLINMTPDATLRVLMDKTTEDYIALNGTGSIRASYFNKGSFDMFGTYLIDHGIYKLTIQNIIKKVFQFQQGGTIVFGGDPYNAALNMKALYTINGVPLSDLQIGKSFSSNNIRVDCIMNIAGTPQSPKVDFDLDLPTVNNDAAQMVRTIINGEEEMNQQVVYLLGVGRFYIQKNNNSSENEEQQNQTSLAMQSLLSGTISQQINSLLGNIVKNNNWTFGANISTGDEGFNNAEYEGLLSGHLLNNRLIFNGQFGYRDNANATTSFIGDFDINYLLLPNGNIALKVYNQTNDRYFTKSSLNTQGIGLIMKKDFNSLMELFGFKRKKKQVPKF